MKKQPMQKIVPHLWFDKEAKEAAKFYVSAFGKNSKINFVNKINDTPSGDAEIVSFTLLDYNFLSIRAGPMFKFNPSISFFVNFDPTRDKNAKENLKKLWKKLSFKGNTLMPLKKYPFSELYGWTKDKYGVSWQLILTNSKGNSRPNIAPSFMFAGKVCGKAKEARDFYVSVFDNSKKGILERYPSGQEPDKEDTVMYEDFSLLGQWFGAMDSARVKDFVFNEAISLVISCDNQKEIDYYWSKLSSDPKAEQCGWCKDKYGVSWQVFPTILGELMTRGTKEQTARVTKAFLQMKKFDIKLLKKAYDGK